MRSIAGMTALAAFAAGLSGLADGLAAQEEALVGAWAAESYVLADGTHHEVVGRIFFTDVDWTVLFFVTEDGEPRRGSAEGGTYRASGKDLVFTHFYHLSAGEAMAGLPASPLRMDLRPPGGGAEEPSTFRVEGGRLTLFFPSGNQMEFSRASGF